MFTFSRILLLGGIVLLHVSAAAQSPAPAPTAQIPSLAPMLERILPGVVAVSANGRRLASEQNLFNDPMFRRFFGLPEQDQSQTQQVEVTGSGIIIDADRGYILTNYHMIENADDISVTLGDGRSLSAEKIGMDRATDLAVVQIEPGNLVAPPIGDSDRLHVGDYVVAVGNPFGLGQTVTMGIVSALGRSGVGINEYQYFIQTDASINPGNSGGPLVDLRGEVVGLNSAIMGPTGSSVGIGFAIPINMARSVMAELIAHGEILRGELGVTIQDLTSELALVMMLDANLGAVVSQVAKGSAADKAGMMAGDVITEINGAGIANAADLQNRVGLMRMGETANVTFLRNGMPRVVSAVLDKIGSAEFRMPADIPLLATVVLATTEQVGALVVQVDNDSPAARGGLLVGDVIVSVNRQPVKTPAEVAALARPPKDGLLLKVIRSGSVRFIAIL